MSPLIEQLPDALKLTGRPELAVALTVNGGSPTILFASGTKVIVCGCGSGALTTTDAVELSLIGFRSSSVADTLAVFPNAPATSAVTVMEMLTPPFTGIDGMVHVTVPLVLAQVPDVLVTDAKLTADGSTSTTWTFVAASGPTLTTRRLYVIVSPTVTEASDADFVIDRSALAPAASSRMKTPLPLEPA